MSFKPKFFILHIKNVPSIDATGIHALNDFYGSCKRHKITLMISGANKIVAGRIKKFGLVGLNQERLFFSDFNSALKRATSDLKEKPR